LISTAIPHFAIRFIDALEKEQTRENINLQERGFKYSDNEFTFYKNLATAIFRVVGYFRKQIIFDQMEVSPARIRIKHNVVH
jgi:hypothetical protein